MDSTPDMNEKPGTRSTRPNERVEWGRLFSPAVDTPITDADTASSDGEGAMAGSESSCAVTGRFGLGSEGEGGRRAWYVPNERTVFPVKKGTGKVSIREESGRVKGTREKDGSADREEQGRMDVCGGSDVWDVTEKEVEYAMRRGAGLGEKGLRLRTRRSLEENILRIEDPEMRRLTAIAYLS